jgi:hypothetical protein
LPRGMIGYEIDDGVHQVRRLLGDGRSGRRFKISTGDTSSAVLVTISSSCSRTGPGRTFRAGRTSGSIVSGAIAHPSGSFDRDHGRGYAVEVVSVRRSRIYDLRVSSDRVGQAAVVRKVVVLSSRHPARSRRRPDRCRRSRFEVCDARSAEIPRDQQDAGPPRRPS